MSYRITTRIALYGLCNTVSAILQPPAIAVKSDSVVVVKGGGVGVVKTNGAVAAKSDSVE